MRVFVIIFLGWATLVSFPSPSIACDYSKLNDLLGYRVDSGGPYRILGKAILALTPHANKIGARPKHLQEHISNRFLAPYLLVPGREVWVSLRSERTQGGPRTGGFTGVIERVEVGVARDGHFRARVLSRVTQSFQHEDGKLMDFPISEIVEIVPLNENGVPDPFAWDSVTLKILQDTSEMRDRLDPRQIAVKDVDLQIEALRASSQLNFFEKYRITLSDGRVLFISGVEDFVADSSINALLGKIVLKQEDGTKLIFDLHEIDIFVNPKDHHPDNWAIPHNDHLDELRLSMDRLTTQYRLKRNELEPKILAHHHAAKNLVYGFVDGKPSPLRMEGSYLKIRDPRFFDPEILGEMRRLTGDHFTVVTRSGTTAVIRSSHPLEPAFFEGQPGDIPWTLLMMTRAESGLSDAPTTSVDLRPSPNLMKYVSDTYGVKVVDLYGRYLDWQWDVFDNAFASTGVSGRTRVFLRDGPHDLTRPVSPVFSTTRDPETALRISILEDYIRHGLVDPPFWRRSSNLKLKDKDITEAPVVDLDEPGRSLDLTQGRTKIEFSGSSVSSAQDLYQYLVSASPAQFHAMYEFLNKRKLLVAEKSYVDENILSYNVRTDNDALKWAEDGTLIFQYTRRILDKPHPENPEFQFQFTAKISYKNEFHVREWFE